MLKTEGLVTGCGYPVFGIGMLSMNSDREVENYFRSKWFLSCGTAPTS
jgi:hypothetical protein